MTREVELTSGLVALIDDEDWSTVNQCVWQTQRVGSTFYAVTNVSLDGRPTSLHRFVMKASSGYLVDHRDGDGLNNRKNNLRVCQFKHNAANRRLGVNNKSGYKGVHWNARSNKWVAAIYFEQKQTILGKFDDPWEAAQAYNRAAVATWGEFAVLNAEGGLSGPGFRLPMNTVADVIINDSPEMTTSEVAKFIGANGIRSANVWLNRHGIKSLYRHSGLHGENVYSRIEVESAKASMPGRGIGGGRGKHRNRSCI